VGGFGGGLARALFAGCFARGAFAGFAHAVGLALDGQDFGVVDQAVDDRDDAGGIEERRAPLGEGAVGGDQGRPPLWQRRSPLNFFSVNLSLEGAERVDGMPRYSEEFKAKVVEKMMPPNARTVADVRRETGISEPTLYAWRRQFQNRGHAVPADSANPESWSGRDKLAVVIETALDTQYQHHPERFVHGPPRAALPPSEVFINPVEPGNNSAPETHLINFPTLPAAWEELKRYL
jgi:transposase-like protein